MLKPQDPTQNKSQIRLIHWAKDTPITQEEAEAHLHREGYNSYCWYDVPGTEYPKHRHEYDECLWILKGELRLTIDGENYILKEGDRLYVPAETPHHTQIPIQQGVTYLVGQK